MKDYKPTIGIEVHAELKTKSKMFCGCKNDPHASEANANTCPVCLAHPGTLPVVNKDAVEKLLIVGNAVEGTIASYTEFDRKNYFYPDIPKAYQLSQYAFPFVTGGTLHEVALTRIHLEEDTARSLHDQGSGSIVDFNRAGVPLMELVTEPVIHDAKTAGAFARELQLLLRSLGVSDANMERGEMRVEANISVSKSDVLGTKVEVKNLNSFKVMESAIDYEIQRQIEVLESGGTLVQETRGWDEGKAKTFSQRSKEQADEYRYFPDPDIPKMDISLMPEFALSRLEEITPELPKNKRVFYSNLGIPSDQVELIVSNIPLDNFFSRVTHQDTFKQNFAKVAANYVTSDLMSLCSDNDQLSLTEAHPDTFLTLIEMLVGNELNSRVAKDLLFEVVFEGLEPRTAASERGLLQMSSDDALFPIIDAVLSEHAAVAEEYKAGKESSLQFLVGQGMKASKGSANPGKLAELFKKKLS